MAGDYRGAASGAGPPAYRANGVLRRARGGRVEGESRAAAATDWVEQRLDPDRVVRLGILMPS
jgi:hypothetical protein